jgi:hypothetical protein
MPITGRQNKRHKMKIKQLLAVALALTLSVWGAAAQNDGPPPGQQGPPPGDNGGPPDGPPPGGGHHRPPPIIQALDTNHDGTISAAEIANASKALLTLDKDGTGQVTLEEALGPRPGPPLGGPEGQQTGDQPLPPGDGDGNQPSGPPPGGQGGGHHHPPVPPIFAVLDTNGDGVLSADEIANAPKNLLKLDKNGDGQLTPDEYRPHRPPPPDQSN